MEEPKQSFIGRYKWYIIGIAALLIYAATKQPKEATVAVEYDETEVVEPTEGVVTTLKEVQPEVFKITDEELVATKDDSRIIANYMDGTQDTFTLQQIAVIDTTIQSEDRGYRRRSGLSTAVHYGLLGYWLGRPMGTPIRQSSYASSDAYSRSQNGRTRMANTATTRAVRTPRPSSTGKSGFGAGKSTKSYGG